MPNFHINTHWQTTKLFRIWGLVINREIYNMLDIFEWKVLHKILKSLNKKGTWRAWYTYELYAFVQQTTVNAKGIVPKKSIQRPTGRKCQVVDSIAMEVWKIINTSTEYYIQLFIFHSYELNFSGQKNGTKF